ncbi:MAG: protein phosphatase 2C domain-containing protein, partial [Candidatus Obscuribacterales bacterium]|nr:protein phosphatase 2C domain-containing protein [Candidatus Obscuribacterales bacterium]
LLGIVGAEKAVFAQIGDGAIVYYDREFARYKTVFWPDNGDYLNLTSFVSSANLEENLQVTSIEGAIDLVAMLTDGLELLALDFRQKIAHGPFFAPMFERLSNTKRPAELESGLRNFLQSEAVNERTDDDKTLIICSRVTEILQSAGELISFAPYDSASD